MMAPTLSPRPLRRGLLSTPDAASVIQSGCVSLFSRTCRAWMDATAVLLLRQPAEVHTGPNGRAIAPPRGSRDLKRRRAHPAPLADGWCVAPPAGAPPGCHPHGVDTRLRP